MDQSAVVEGAMLDFNTRFPLVDEQMKTHVRYLFNLVWMAGWEQRGKELAHNRWREHKYIFQQFDRDGNLIGEYINRKEAEERAGICRTSFWKALNGRVTIHGHTWKRKLIEGVSEVEQEDGLLNTEVIAKPNIDKLPSSNT